MPLLPYLSTNSAFLPFVGAALHSSHRFSAGTVSVLALRPLKLAPGMSSSQSALICLVAMASSIEPRYVQIYSLVFNHRVSPNLPRSIKFNHFRMEFHALAL